MKCVLLFTALFAAWISSSEATTCEKIGDCVQGMAQFASADESKLKEACAAMKNVLSCFKGGLQDCRDKNPDNSQQLNMIESQMSNVEKMVNDHCGASAATISIALLLFALLSIFF